MTVSLKKQLSVAIALLFLSFPVVAQTKVVVVPLFGDDAPAAPASRVVFVTRDEHDGNFGGPEGADQFCQEQADANGSLVQGKTFVAWISGNVADDFSDDGRSFFRSKLPYQRVDGVVVANNFTELTSSQGIISPILIDQYGNGVQGSPDTWTGEPSDPSRFGDNCSNWTEGGFARGTTGDRRQAGPGWDVNGSTECFVPNHLYCFEQPE